MKTSKKNVWNVIVLALAFIVCTATVGILCWPSFKQAYYTHHPEGCETVARLNNSVRVLVFDGKYFVYNTALKRTTISGMGNFYRETLPDSIPIWYSKGGHRGFFHPTTGEPLIDDNTYTHAWIFSEGLAAVEKDGIVKFIDLQGRVAIDQGFHFDPTLDDYCFRNGYCIMSDSTGLRGLIGKDGKWAVLPQYEHITYANDSCWVVCEQDKEGFLNSRLQQALACEYKEIIPTEDNGVTVTMPDGSMRQYDYDGNIISPCVFTDVTILQYTSSEPSVNYDEVMYVADCMSYGCSNERLGLLTKDFRPLTPPVYRRIEAFAKNRFLCTMENGVSLIIDEHGKPLQQ